MYSRTDLKNLKRAGVCSPTIADILGTMKGQTIPEPLVLNCGLQSLRSVMLATGLVFDAQTIMGIATQTNNDFAVYKPQLPAVGFANIGLTVSFMFAQILRLALDCDIIICMPRPYHHCRIVPGSGGSPPGTLLPQTAHTLYLDVEAGHWEHFDNAAQSAPWNDVGADTETDEYFPQHHARTWITKCQAFQSLYLESEFIPTGCERLAGWMFNYLAAVTGGNQSASQPAATTPVVAAPAPVAPQANNPQANAQPVAAPAGVQSSASNTPPPATAAPPLATQASGGPGRGNGGGKRSGGRGRGNNTDVAARPAAVPAVANPRASAKPSQFSDLAVRDYNVYTRSVTSDDWNQFQCDPQTLPKGKAHPYLHMGRDKLSEHINSFDLGKVVWVVGGGGSHELIFVRETTIFFCPSEHTVPGGDSNKASHMHEVLTALPNVEMSQTLILNHNASLYKTADGCHAYVIDATLDMVTPQDIYNHPPNSVIMIDVAYYLNSNILENRCLLSLRHLRMALLMGSLYFSLHWNPLTGTYEFRDELKIFASKETFKTIVADMRMGQKCETEYEHPYNPTRLVLGNAGHTVGAVGFTMNYGEGFHYSAKLIGHFAKQYQLLLYKAHVVGTRTMDEIIQMSRVVAPKTLDTTPAYTTPPQHRAAMVAKLPSITVTNVVDCFANTGKDGQAIATKYGATLHSNDSDELCVKYYGLTENLTIDGYYQVRANRSSTELIYWDPPYYLYSRPEYIPSVVEGDAHTVVVKHPKTVAIPGFRNLYSWDGHNISIWTRALETTGQATEAVVDLAMSHIIRSGNTADTMTRIAPALRATGTHSIGATADVIQAALTRIDATNTSSSLAPQTPTPLPNPGNGGPPDEWWVQLLRKIIASTPTWQTVGTVTVIGALGVNNLRYYLKQYYLRHCLQDERLSREDLLKLSKMSIDFETNRPFNELQNPFDDCATGWFDRPVSLDDMDWTVVLPDGQVQLYIRRTLSLGLQVGRTVVTQLMIYLLENYTYGSVRFVAGCLVGQDASVSMRTLSNSLCYLYSVGMGRLPCSSTLVASAAVNTAVAAYTGYRIFKSLKRVHAARPSEHERLHRSHPFWGILWEEGIFLAPTLWNVYTRSADVIASFPVPI